MPGTDIWTSFSKLSEEKGFETDPLRAPLGRNVFEALCHADLGARADETRPGADEDLIVGDGGYRGERGGHCTAPSQEYGPGSHGISPF